MTELERKSLQHVKDMITNINTYQVHVSLKETLDKDITDKEIILKHMDNELDKIDNQKYELIKWLDSIISSTK